MQAVCKICKGKFNYEPKHARLRILCSEACRRRNHANNALESHNRKVLRELL